MFSMQDLSLCLDSMCVEFNWMCVSVDVVGEGV